VAHGVSGEPMTPWTSHSLPPLQPQTGMPAKEMTAAGPSQLNGAAQYKQCDVQQQSDFEPFHGPVPSSRRCYASRWPAQRPRTAAPDTDDSHKDPVCCYAENG